MKKLLAILLTVTMLLGVVFALPVTAFAEGEDEGGGEAVTPETNTFYLYNAEGWENVYFNAYSSTYGTYCYEEPGLVEPSDTETITGVTVYEVTVDAVYDQGEFSNDEGIVSNGWGTDGQYYNNNLCGWYNNLDTAYGTLYYGDWEYGFNSDGTIYIFEYYGNDAVVEIPETINGVSVTSTAKSIMWDNTDATELHVPKTLTQINGQLVGYGQSIEKYVVDPENPVYESINGSIVHTETMTLVQGCIYQEIPDGIRVIGSGAFANLRELSPATFVIPDSVVEIEDGAFGDNDKLESINIPASVTSIGTRVFAGCNNLNTITVDEENEYYSDNGDGTLIEIETNTILRGTNTSTIPDYITKIDDYAFEGCNELDGVTVPEGVTYIGEQAFSYCYSLSAINIPAATTFIGEDAFIFCEDLRTITVDDANEVYYSGSSNAIIERGETEKLIVGCAGTIIPDGVDVIGGESFYGMENLIKIDIPASVYLIESGAFSECNSLRRAIIRNAECEIEDWSVDWDTAYDPEASEGEDEDGYFLEGPVGSTITNESYKMSEEVVIVGYVGSTAERYATCAGRPFHNIEEPYNTVIYFINSDGWENITDETAKAYFYNAEGTTVHPTSVEKVEDIEEFDVYALTFDDFYDFVIFTGDGEEADSYDTEFISDWYFNWEDKEWYESIDDLLEGGDDEVWEEDYSGYYLLIDYVDESMEDYLYVDSDNVEWSNNLYEDDVHPYRINEYLEPGDRIKVVYYDYDLDEVTEFYPDENSAYNWYQVNVEDYGRYTIYFDPDGNDEWEYHYVDIVDYVCDHEYNSYGVCDYCRKLAPGVNAGLYGYRIVLDGYIAVEYYMVLSDEAVADPASAMKFMVPNGDKQSELVLPVDYEFDNNENDDVLSVGNNMYVFTCHISAKDIASLIEAEFVTCGETITIRDYSVKRYLEGMLFDYYDYELDEEYETDEDRPYAETVPLAKAMLNYGAAAQKYFGVNLNNLANDSEYMTEEDKEIKAVDFSSFKPTLEGTQEGVSYYGTSLSLKSETSIKHYFYFENDEDVEALAPYTDASRLEIAKNGGYYELKIARLYVQDLDEMYKVTIGDTTLTYSGFSFGYMIMQQDGNEELKETLYALYEFNEQAEYYTSDED